jgi:hypothetical protein
MDERAYVPAAGGDPCLGVFLAALWDHGEDCVARVSTWVLAC